MNANMEPLAGAARGKEGGPASKEARAYIAAVYKELVVCDSSGCAHVSHPQIVTKRASISSVPGGWRNAYIEKREKALIISIPLVSEGRVIIIVREPDYTVWW
jgi:hypothetical protein